MAVHLVIALIHDLAGPFLNVPSDCLRTINMKLRSKSNYEVPRFNAREIETNTSKLDRTLNSSSIAGPVRTC
jgi:hypothetical protein